MPADLVVTLETPLPASLPAGTRTALFLYGTCAHRAARITRLEVLAGGTRHRPRAWGMPRPDVPGAAHGGFWAVVPVTVGAGGVELAVAASLAGGGEAVASLGRIPVAEPAVAPLPFDAAPSGLIAVCMATFEPDLALFETQIASLRGQRDEGWMCVISDDASGPDAFAAITAVVGDDPRFVVSRSEERLGFYRNFERALRLAPPAAELVALCDQDDRWHPDKLATLRAALGTAQLAYSDQRLVAADGRVLRETMWRGRANNHTDITSMLVANSITGAASLLRREVAELALPFPESPGLPFHDHWIALVALAAGDVAYVDRPLYDYVQHRGAFFGAVTHGDGPAEDRPARLRAGRGAYFRGYLPRVTLAEAALARCAGRIAPAKARALRRFAAAERSPAAFAWLAARPLRVLAGRTETLGSESELIPGLVWRWALELARRLPPGLARRLPPALDARMPDVLSFQQRRLRRWRADV